jgi:hypothetical protein
MTEYLTSMTLDYAKVERDLKVCDIVEFNRLTYSHYAFHIGNGIFVHVTGDSDRGKGGGKGTKCAQTLRTIANKDACRINNLEAARLWQDVGSARGPTEERSVSNAKRLALDGIKLDGNGKPLLGIENGKTVSYHLMGWNCERYCTYWKYDCDGFSQQAYNGAISSTLGNGQRMLDAAAAGYFHVMDDAPVVVKPLCAVAGGIVKAGAITVGTGKAVVDGATSFTVGAFESVIKLFK